MYQGVFTLAEYLDDEGEAPRKREQAPIKLAFQGILQEPRDLVQTSMSPGVFQTLANCQEQPCFPRPLPI